MVATREGDKEVHYVTARILNSGEGDWIDPVTAEAYIAIESCVNGADVWKENDGINYIVCTRQQDTLKIVQVSGYTWHTGLYHKMYA